MYLHSRANSLMPSLLYGAHSEVSLPWVVAHLALAASQCVSTAIDILSNFSISHIIT